MSSQSDGTQAEPTSRLASSRDRPEERARIEDLLALIPVGRTSILDVGARDGYISCLLASSFREVVALDLERPQVPDGRVTTVKGDVTCLQFSDNAFDSVVCAEVLEHIPSKLLQKACDEITRVARHHVVIGVPFKQDIRVGRTTCYSCGKKNPPWGHVNVFDEERLKELFSRLRLGGISFVGERKSRTNALSALLTDLAGNPYGTYDQEESCIHCGARLLPPPPRTLLQRVFTKLGFCMWRAQQPFVSPEPAWVHVLLNKPGTPVREPQLSSCRNCR
jgi:hypothetical protein